MYTLKISKAFQQNFTRAVQTSLILFRLLFSLAFELGLSSIASPFGRLQEYLDTHLKKKLK